MLKEFRDFAMRGNVVDLAVAVIIGAAFGKVVSSLVDDIFMPIIGIFGKADFSNYFLPLSSAVTAGNLADAKKQGGVLAYGHFVTDVISFIIIALALFLVIKAVNSLKKKEVVPPPAPPAPPRSEVLLEEIRDALVKRA
jgi:large conductance mechanosensitive channel